MVRLLRSAAKRIRTRTHTRAHTSTCAAAKAGRTRVDSYYQKYRCPPICSFAKANWYAVPLWVRARFCVVTITLEIGSFLSSSNASTQLYVCACVSITAYTWTRICGVLEINQTQRRRRSMRFMCEDTHTYIYIVSGRVRFER